ncbi:binding-protein-dependent transport systems inner membrane component [Kribbella flavida DSM 17836]|uniref:Binding-protein-dependent transport systems inner membrane component n=1 Tax=Kribbella flavida (strain DSM 17836 / JCM 10339 / NBRC 14399) TaxID=479435 RepID=D2PR80_KRIFD|nr:ABC transporter permease [Kribbella flavida]ADB33028.1 binding-protein-dependent transport systems inner membrane component [Kribbella flavida DSM 17836]
MTAFLAKNDRAPSRLGDRRRRTLAYLGLSLLMVAAVAVFGTLSVDEAGSTQLGARNLGPSWAHLFGTDRLGRDMLARVLSGLRLSLVVGVSAALVSGAIALLMACLAAVGGRLVDRAVSWLVDLFLALPHLVLLILLAFALGGGTRAVIIAVAVTHWPTLTRVLRGHARQVMSSDYVLVARSFGRGRWWIARRHVAPQLVGHFVVGTALLFPHAILHEAALSFLGLGVDPAEPSIGVLLAESMRFLSAGAWWLAVLPGLCLLIVVKLVDAIGENTRALLDPRSHHL